MRSESNMPPAIDPLALASSRSYGTAVALSAVFGFLGVQHFYLGRHREGALDVGLPIDWIWCFAVGEFGWGVAFALADFGHSFIVSILLLIGNFRDGEGRIVPYPGQRLGIGNTNQDMRRPI